MMRKMTLQKLLELKIHSRHFKPPPGNVVFLNQTIFFSLQMKWKNIPICFYPETMRGKPISKLEREKLEYCHDYLDEETHDAASTSYNILDESSVNLFAIAVASSVVLLVLLIVIIATICNRHGAQYYTRENEKLGKLNNKLDRLGKFEYFFTNKRFVLRSICITNAFKCSRLP